MKKIKFNLFFLLPFLIFILQFPSEGFSVDTTYLEQTSKAFTEISKKATPAVVFIKAQYTSEESAEPENPFDNFNDEFFKHFFHNPRRGFKPQPSPQISGGSGFIVTSDGNILTNNHVIKDANKITVITHDGKEYDAKLIGADPKTDLAIIKIDAKNLPFLTFGNSDKLEIGEWVIAIGNPFALQASLTVGVVSAKNRQNLRITDYEDFLQTDAAINPGNSGGPLLNIKGEVIGVNTAIVSQSGGYMGIGFAIPSNMAKRVRDQLIDSGSVKRGYLGVFLQEIDKEMSEALGLEKSEGVLISDVTKDSPAEKAGLKQGDIIVEYNGTPVKTLSSFRNDISLLEPGVTLSLKILREGKKESFKIQLGSYPDEAQITQQSNQLGIEVSEIKDISPDVLSRWGYAPNTEGVIISNIKRGSNADKAGIKPGMLLMQVNQKKIKSVKDFQESLKGIDKKSHLILLIRYQNITRFISIKL